jgi:hypothetical protein
MLHNDATEREANARETRDERKDAAAQGLSSGAAGDDVPSAADGASGEGTARPPLADARTPDDRGQLSVTRRERNNLRRID